MVWNLINLNYMDELHTILAQGDIHCICVVASFFLASIFSVVAVVKFAFGWGGSLHVFPCFSMFFHYLGVRFAVQLHFHVLYFHFSCHLTPGDSRAFPAQWIASF